MKRPDRQCGPCTLCCTVMHVPDLAKPAGKPCADLCATGCGIYATRPGVCRQWQCDWLKGDLPDDWRPDLIGVVFTPAMGGAVRGAQVDPARPDAWRTLDLSIAGPLVGVSLNGQPIGAAFNGEVR